MKRLRELRAVAKYTQEDLAEMLQVSQQTIARWETGKAEPNIAALRDIAVIFGTSVDDLLEMENNKTAKITTNRYHFLGQGTSDGFWGHIGLLLPGKEKTQWYPITLGEADRLGAKLFDRNSSDHDWLVVSTLNNRMLAFAISAVKRIWLLDDNVDQPSEDDWELSWDGYEGYSPEIYGALEEYFYFSENDEYKVEYSETLRKIIQELVEKHKLDEEKLEKWILDTHIHFVDGTSTNYRIENKQLHNLVYEIDMEEDRSVFRLDDICGAESFYPATAVRLIDMPLLKYRDGYKEELAQMEREDNLAGKTLEPS